MLRTLQSSKTEKDAKHGLFSLSFLSEELKTAMISDNKSSEAILTLTSETFKSLVLDSKGETVVEFMSYGCPHCRDIEPILQEIAQSPDLPQKFYRVDVAVEVDLEESFSIEGTPTFLMFLDGVEVGRSEGPTPTLSNVLAVVTEPFDQ